MSQPSAEPKYTKWIAIIGAVVAVLSLLLNLVLGISTLRLEQEKSDIERTLSSVELENRELDNLVRQQELRVDLETRFFVITGLAIYDFTDTMVPIGGGEFGLVQNQVLQRFNGWKERWASGGDMTDYTTGGQSAHAIVFFRVSNRGQQDAHDIVLTTKWWDFAEDGRDAANIWELNTTDWEEDTVQLADLEVGDGVLVPIAHILGTYTFFDRVLIPTELEWFNPVLQKRETMTVEGMTSEDQWISRGTNISLAQ